MKYFKTDSNSLLSLFSSMVVATHVVIKLDGCF